MRRALPFALVLLLTAPAAAQEAEPPTIAGFGDSITNGKGVLPEERYIDRIAATLGWTPVLVAKNGASASCWGRTQASTVVATGADVVIVAFGTNDMSSTPLCKPTINQYRLAMRDILAKLRAGLPEARLYVQAILWRKGFTGKRFWWNAVAQKEAEAVGAVFLDPNVPPERFPDGLHPDAEGHRLIADAWVSVLSA